MHKPNQIKLYRLTDRRIEFSLWIDRRIAASLLVKDDKVERAIRQECGDCHVVMGASYNVGDRYKFDGWVCWGPVGDDSPEAPDRLRIGRFISELPNQSFIEDFTHIHQLYAWMEWKYNCISIAKCFLAGHGSPENPLLRALEEGEIDQYYHDHCWLLAQINENLWKLLSLKEKSIKAGFKERGWDFSSPRIVLEQILASEVNGEFSVILKPRHEVNPKELKRLAILQNHDHKGFGLNKADEEERKRLVKKYSSEPESIWLDRVFAIAAILAKKDALIRTHLEIHRALMRGITKLRLDAACKPHLKKHGQVSSTWINGQKFPGLNHKWRA